jgi:hypothetical protein
MYEVLLCHAEHIARVGEEHVSALYVLGHVLILALLEVLQLLRIVGLLSSKPSAGGQVPSGTRRSTRSPNDTG